MQINSIYNMHKEPLAGCIYFLNAIHRAAVLKTKTYSIYIVHVIQRKVNCKNKKTHTLAQNKLK